MQNPHEFRKTPHLKWTKIQAIHIIILIFFHPSPPFCRRNLKESGCDSFESYGLEDGTSWYLGISTGTDGHLSKLWSAPRLGRSFICFFFDVLRIRGTHGIDHHCSPTRQANPSGVRLVFGGRSLQLT